jgi:hypothetical protein
VIDAAYDVETARKLARGRPDLHPSVYSVEGEGGENVMRLAASFSLALMSAIVLLYVGLWLGSQPRTCAVVESTQGHVVLCSNSWVDKVAQ